jgi:hypothetical protein
MVVLRVFDLVWTVRLRIATEHTAITESVRRVEVFMGAGRRRTWISEDMVRIVAEGLTSREIRVKKTSPRRSSRS